MAQGNLAACLPVTLAYEGGLSTIRSDPGNWTGGVVGVGTLKGTNFGIAASSHPSLDIAHLTKADAQAIYDREYWTPAACEALPAGLDLVHFDGTVNSGRGRSAKWLAKASAGATTARIHAYSSARLSFDQALANWARFGKAWGTRVAGVEAKALKMALGQPDGTLGAAAAGVIAQKAAAHASTAARAASMSRAATAVAGGAAVAATAHPVAGTAVGLAAIVTAAWSAFVTWRAGTRAAALTHAV